MYFPPFRTASLCAVALLAAGLLPGPAARAQSGVENKLTVGVVSRAYLIQSYYRSEAWATRMQSLVEERNNAAVRSDMAAVDRLDKEFNDAQTIAQRQLAGNAPLKNIYDSVKAQWPAIVKEAGVDIIVESPVYVTPGSALVDVTPIIVKHFPKRT